MKKELLKLPLYLLISGFVIRVIERIAVFTIMRGISEWNWEMGNKAFYVRLTASIILFVLIGIRLSKIYIRKTCFISASLVVGYSIIALLIEQISQSMGTYSMISYYMYIPIDIFVTLTSLMGRIFNPGSLSLVYVVPSLFAPYLFLLFTKKDVNDV